MSRRVAVNLVAFLGVFVLMLWWAVNNIVSFDFIERPYQITGEFAATAGVAPDSEVAYLGVNHGAVRSVESVDGMVVITMDIDRGKEIPAGSTARIFRKSAIGEPYIDFVPPAGHQEGDAVLEEGAVIPLERTTVPLEFSELLRAASRVLGSVEPDELRTLVHELAVALDGRGAALRDLTVSSDALLATFADRAELLDSLSANSTRLTRTVAEHRSSLSAAIGDLADLAETVRAVEPDTNVLLDRGTRLLEQSADLVSDVKGDLDCVLSDLDELIELTTTDGNLGNLAYSLEEGPGALDFVFMTRDDGPDGLWVRVNVLFERTNPAKAYVPPTELPAVPQVPPCVSRLAEDDGEAHTGGGSTDVAAGTPATGTDVGAGTSSQPRDDTGGRDLTAILAARNAPATGGDPLAALVLVLLAGGAFCLHAHRTRTEPTEDR